MHCIVRVLLSTLCLGLASGCAVHSPTRAKQGEELAAAWAKVDIAARVKSLREAQQTLLDRHLAVEDEVWAFNRNRAAELLATSWTGRELRTYLDQQLLRLAGSAEGARTVLEAFHEANKQLRILAAPRATAALAGAPLPECHELLVPAGEQAYLAKVAALGDPGRQGVIAAALESAAGSCRALVRAQAVKAPGGQLSAAQQALKEDEDKLSAQRSVLADSQRAYEAAKSTYETAVRDHAAGAGTAERVERALMGLASLAEKLTELDSDVGVELASRERLDALNRFLTAYEDVKAGKAAPQDANKAAVALAVFPDLMDKARKALADVDKPRLLPLVLQKQVEQARLDAAQSALARRHRLLALRKQYVAELSEQVRVYAEVADSLRQEPLRALETRPIHLVLNARDAVDGELRTETWRRVTQFLDAEGRLRAAAGKTRHRITDTAFEEALAHGESALMQWKALLDPSVELLAAYGASGLKASDVAEFLNTLSLLWIASKVGS